MSTNVKKISIEALDQVTGGNVPSYVRLPDVLCDECNDNEALYIKEYYENKDIALISCSRCGEGFYWDYKTDDYGDCPFFH